MFYNWLGLHVLSDFVSTGVRAAVDWLFIRVQNSRRLVLVSVFFFVTDIRSGSLSSMQIILKYYYDTLYTIPIEFSLKY